MILKLLENQNYTLYPGELLLNIWGFFDIKIQFKDLKFGIVATFNYLCDIISVST